MRSMASLLAVSLAIFGAAQVASADEVVQQTTTTYPSGVTSEKTVTTTTTTATAPTSTFTLSGDASYIVVDPTRGPLTGTFDVTRRLLNGQPLTSGVYIVEQASGKVYATVDSSGNIVTVSAVPAVVPQNFVVVDGGFYFKSDEFALRRAQLATRIAAEHAAGKLSHEQVKELREDLNEIARLSAQKNRKGEYSSSTKRKIETKFAKLQDSLEKDIAYISKKRANIGIVNH